MAAATALGALATSTRMSEGSASLRLPRLMQAPIGPATGPGLVTAVSAAGGLGCLAASWTPPDVLREQLRVIGRVLDRPYAVNLVMAFDQGERLEVVLEERVPVLSMSWGVDQAAVARAHAAGALVLVQVGDTAAARDAATAGVDAVIVQGVEAGGHVQGTRPLASLVRDVRSQVSLPIFAAGGVATPRAARLARDAGAFGVACGTAFLVAEEADVHPTYCDMVLAAGAEDAFLTGIFDLGWRNAPHRVLRNETVERWHVAGRPPAGTRPGEGDVVAHRSGRAILRYSAAQPTRDTVGDVASMALYAGTGVGDVVREEAAADITGRLLSASRGGP